MPGCAMDVAVPMAGVAAQRTSHCSPAGGAIDTGDRIQRRMQTIASLHQASDAPSVSPVQQATSAVAATLATMPPSRTTDATGRPAVRPGSPVHGAAYGIAAPIANAAQAPSRVQAHIANALSGLRQRCRGNDNSGLRQASMARLQSGKTRWRRPRNLAAPGLSQRDRIRTIAHWTMRRAFVYQQHRHASGLPCNCHCSVIVPQRSRWLGSGEHWPAPSWKRRRKTAPSTDATHASGGARHIRCAAAVAAQSCSARAWWAMCSPMKLPMK